MALAMTVINLLSKTNQKSAETRINTGFFKQLDLFKLNRSRRFPRAVIEYAVYVWYFVYDTTGNGSENFPRNFSSLSSHKVDGVYSSQGDA